MVKSGSSDRARKSGAFPAFLLPTNGMLSSLNHHPHLIFLRRKASMETPHVILHAHDPKSSSEQLSFPSGDKPTKTGTIRILYNTAPGELTAPSSLGREYGK